MKKLALYAFLAFSLILSQISFANMNKCCAESPMKMMVSKLNLSSEQQDKIKAIKEQAKSTLRPSFAQMKEIRTKMNELIHSDKIDEEKLNTLINQKKELMATILKTKVMAKNQIFNVLDASQKAQFKNMMKEWEDNRKMCKKC